MAYNERNPHGYPLRPTVWDDMVLTERGTTAKFTVSGLSPDSIDRTGNLSPVKLCRIFEKGLVSLYHRNHILHSLMDSPHKSAFAVTCHIEIVNREIYKRVRNKLWFSSFDVTTSLAGVYKKTFDCLTLLEDTSDKTLLGWSKIKCIGIDMHLRKPLVIPHEIREICAAYARPEYEVETYLPSEKPSNAYCSSFVIRPSDIDFNGHTNGNSYNRIGVDVAAEACFEGHFSNFHGDLARYELKTLTGMFQNESSLGDIITAYCWEDISRADTLHCELVRTDKATCVYMTITFYPLVNSKI